MKISQNKQDSIQVFELSGELDFHSSPELRDRLQHAMDGSSPKVIVNMKGVTYIDSSGLATFVEALQKGKRTGGTLVLTELAPAVKSVFEIAKLDKVFTLTASYDEALGQVSG